MNGSGLQGLSRTLTRLEHDLDAIVFLGNVQAEIRICRVKNR
jgi:hypothetical protein